MIMWDKDDPVCCMVTSLDVGAAVFVGSSNGEAGFRPGTIRALTLPANGKLGTVEIDLTEGDSCIFHYGMP